MNTSAKIICAFIVWVLAPVAMNAQTFTTIGDTIPDDGTIIEFPITVSGIANTINDTSFGLERVCINLTHTWDSDMRIWIIAPDSTIVMLIDNCGGSDDNFTNTCLNDQAAKPIITQQAPFTGTYRPIDQLGVINNLQNPNGIWRLRILDTYPFADFGILNFFSLFFSNTPSKATNVDSTFLPLVLIDTYKQTIIDEPKIFVGLKVIDNGPGNYNHVGDTILNYNGFAGIELRGHSSNMFAQKQYGLELRDSMNHELDTPLLGLPSESDFVLSGPYTDKSLIRNALTSYVSSGAGQYAMRYKFCEVILNHDYKGVYALLENVKRGKNRVDIAKMDSTDTSGVALTGGYICKFDWGPGLTWTSNFPPDPTDPYDNTVEMLMHYPKEQYIMPQQFDYIKSYIDSFETALFATYYTDTAIGWRNYADEQSFIDFLIVNEVARNVDGYRLSTFFYKKRDDQGRKIFMGPVWDFNLAWRNADYCNGSNFTGWAYRLTDVCEWDMPYWWKRMLSDPQFALNLRCRWDYLRTTVLDTSHLFHYMDSMSNYLSVSAAMHFARWPIMGIYVWPNPAPLAQNYLQEFYNMKQWINNRINWLDNNMPGMCTGAGVNEALSSDFVFAAAPNPATDVLHINYRGYSNAMCHITVVNGEGKQVYHTLHHFAALIDQSLPINVANFAPGIHAITIRSGQQIFTLRFVKI